ncbi:translocon-associated protein [Musa troglodytarum]|uniref:Translocon-associated protein n=1 Tax=Musa troglodytarum TaxID=320322 RepID=A0A9E7JTH1_9LILI|nr:translocon-associated protein [Musa troglodytarum]
MGVACILRLLRPSESTLKVVAIHASLHLPFDHHMFVQNLTLQEFYIASVPVSAQATFPCRFAVSKYLQVGATYQSVFYNGIIEVIEAGGFLCIDSKTKGSPMVEVGTKTMDAEWVAGTGQVISSKLSRSKSKARFNS